MNKLTLTSLSALLAAGSFAACGGPVEEPAGIEAPAETAQTVIRGSVVDPVGFQTVRVLFDGGMRCTGVLVMNDWVLTANHCFNYPTDAARLSITFGDGTPQRSNVVELLRHPSSIDNKQFVDIALLRLETPMVINASGVGFRQKLWPGSSSDLKNKIFECVGYGLADLTVCSNTCSTARDGRCQDGGPNASSNTCAFGTDCADCGSRGSNPTTARTGQFDSKENIQLNAPQPPGSAGDLVTLVPNSLNQVNSNGDSGGGCFVTEGGVRYLASITAGWRACRTAGGCRATGGYGESFSTLISTPGVWDWVMRTAYHRRAGTLLAHGENCVFADPVAGSAAFTWDCGPPDTSTMRFTTHFQQQWFVSDGRRFRFGAIPEFTLGTREPAFSNHSLVEANTFSSTHEETFRFLSEVVGIADKCIDVRGGVIADGTPVQMWDCNGSTAQLWTYRSSDNSFALPNKQKCLDVEGGVLEQGRSIHLWGCNSTNAQRWLLGPDKQIRLEANPNLCLDVRGGSFANETRLQLWPCNQSPAQQWFLRGAIQKLGVAAAPTGKCLDVRDFGTANGTPLQIFDCSPSLHSAQQFEFHP